MWRSKFNALKYAYAINRYLVLGVLMYFSYGKFALLTSSLIPDPDLPVTFEIGLTAPARDLTTTKASHYALFHKTLLNSRTYSSSLTLTNCFAESLLSAV